MPADIILGDKIFVFQEIPDAPHDTATILVTIASSLKAAKAQLRARLKAELASKPKPENYSRAQWKRTNSYIVKALFSNTKWEVHTAPATPGATMEILV